MTTDGSTFSTEEWTSIPGGNITASLPVTTQDYITTQEYVTTTEENDTIPEYVGFIAVIIAILFYGITYAPVKKFDTGDGMFFQWIYCSATMITGVVVQLIRNCPTFHPIVMLGGMFFATGNVCVVPIVKCIGLGVGLCIWGMVNLLSGWATGRFGLFGVHEQVPHNTVLNYVGVGLAVSSAVIFALVKNQVSTAGIDSTIAVTESERSPLLRKDTRDRSSLHTTHAAHHDIIVFSDKRRKSSTSATYSGTNDDESDESFVDRLGPRGKKILGLVLCVASGLMYGQTFTAATHVQDNFEGASQNGLDYVFATFCGIFITSTVYFIIYAVYKRNQPKIYPRAMLPGFVAGIIWSIATACWFIANKVLSLAVAFPIISTGPGIITAILGVFVFNEIAGRRNYLILSLAITVTVTGSVLTGLSF